MTEKKSKQNKFGLSRYVPSDVARTIRKRCGFGCVICGLGFYDYEHFAPDFAEAREHHPDGMTLLCSQCNQKRARGRLSAETVAEANRNPRCLQKGFSHEMFDFASGEVEVIFAGVSFFDCQHLIMVNGQSILSIKPPAEAGQSVLLSGLFTDGMGRTTLVVEDNVWMAQSSNWDVECIGPRITVRTALGEIALQLLMEPSASRLTIERLDMRYQGAHFKGDKGVLQLSLNGQGWNTFSACSVRSCSVGIAIETGPRAANDRVFHA
ncbi:hypothetical protein [Comamonas kerstersii]|uniref:hypothetical protein n=1 Tax=Comamonas kerstersii TaxID=225992 RepID=UPI00345CC7DF